MKFEEVHKILINLSVLKNLYYKLYTHSNLEFIAYKWQNAAQLGIIESGFTGLSLSLLDDFDIEYLAKDIKDGKESFMHTSVFQEYFIEFNLNFLSYDLHWKKTS